MMRKLLWVFCAVFPAVALAQASSLPTCRTVEPSTPGALAGILPHSSVEHIFLSLEDVEPGRLELRYRVSGEIALYETLDLERVVAEDGRPQFAEILAIHPRERSILLRQHEAAPGTIEAEVWNNGSWLRTLSFEELRQGKQQLFERSVLPEPVLSRVRAAGSLATRSRPQLAQRAPTCEDSCYEDYLLCLESTCPDVEWCEECEQQYSSCLGGCCSYQVTYYWTSWYQTSSYYTGFWMCFQDYYISHPYGRHYRERGAFYRRDYIKRTKHDDCSVTEEVVNYETQYATCYEWTSVWCYGPYSQPFGVCW